MQRNRQYTGQQYISGSAARQLQVVPEVKRVKEENIFVQRSKARKSSNQVLYSSFLLIAVVVTLFVCVKYLNTQIAINGQMTKISSLEKQLAKITNENSVIEDKLNMSVDLKEIYKVATEELGMIYPAKDQVEYYDKQEGFYVKQLGDIPTTVETANSLLGIVSKGR